MKFDHSWQALLRPDVSSHYFPNFHRWPFDPKKTTYDPVNSLWLSELSRWIYRHDRDQYRSAFSASMVHPELEMIHLREMYFIEEKGMQASLLVSSMKPYWAVLIFRGSSEPTNWIYNFKTSLSPWFGGGLVHQGFLEALISIWEPIRHRLRRIRRMPIFFAGHSLGGALATLAAADYSPSALYAFGAPRVGDSGFSTSLSGTPVYRVVNHNDMVCWLPPSTPPFRFRHVGELHYFSYSGNKYVNPDDEFIEYDRRVRVGDARAEMHERNWTDPPKRLSDHSPINYSANIYREVMGHPLYHRWLDAESTQIE
ncbi:lipase family protein [Litoribrevibacter albus]|uniref:Fungal lipase-type domain-containing protein n=1 Tax=Litoribrevibacter albus TaxID=1473156 RepID=A0AA37SDG4_9GAMM|nr:lipase family protein [Litoribrevibacter albus]GLQ32402.1 hypothetical protein GCM10007876_28810 [Litoribrevibacter albus]